MILALAVLVGVLFAAGTYLLIQRTLTRIILGVSLYGHAVNVLLLASGCLYLAGMVWNDVFDRREDALRPVVEAGQDADHRQDDDPVRHGEHDTRHP